MGAPGGREPTFKEKNAALGGRWARRANRLSSASGDKVHCRPARRPYSSPPATRLVVFVVVAAVVVTWPPLEQVAGSVGRPAAADRCAPQFLIISRPRQAGDSPASGMHSTRPNEQSEGGGANFGARVRYLAATVCESHLLLLLLLLFVQLQQAPTACDLRDLSSNRFIVSSAGWIGEPLNGRGIERLWRHRPKLVTPTSGLAIDGADEEAAGEERQPTRNRWPLGLAIALASGNNDVINCSSAAADSLKAPALDRETKRDEETISSGECDGNRWCQRSGGQLALGRP